MAIIPASDKIHICRDTDDDKFISCAVDGKVLIYIKITYLCFVETKVIVSFCFIFNGNTFSPTLTFWIFPL